MRTIIALAMIAILGGFGTALASDHGRDDARATQERSISAATNDDEAGEHARAEATHEEREAGERGKAGEHKEGRDHDDSRDDRDDRRGARD